MLVVLVPLPVVMVSPRVTALEKELPEVKLFDVPTFIPNDLLRLIEVDVECVLLTLVPVVLETLLFIAELIFVLSPSATELLEFSPYAYVFFKNGDREEDNSSKPRRLDSNSVLCSGLAIKTAAKPGLSGQKSPGSGRICPAVPILPCSLSWDRLLVVE